VGDASGQGAAISLCYRIAREGARGRRPSSDKATRRKRKGNKGGAAEAWVRMAVAVVREVGRCRAGAQGGMSRPEWGAKRGGASRPTWAMRC
jgi:hypothetical protein